MESDRFRVLLTGSQTWDQPRVIFAALLETWDDASQNGREIVWVHGHCDRGADAQADTWLVAQGFTPERHPADWDRCAPTCKPEHRRTRRDGTTYCPAAGLRRDAEMVDLGADLCLAWIAPCTKQSCRKPKPHGSHGASHTADLAEKAGIPTRRYERSSDA